MIAGHTHQERSLARTRGPGIYFNSGTWVAVMQFTDEQLSSTEKFAALFTALRNARTIADLETFPGLVERRPAAVCITKEGGTVLARLQRVSLVQGNIQLSDVAAKTEGTKNG